MDRVRIKSISLDTYKGSNITVCGWVKSKRESKNCTFVIINDGSCQSDLQLVVDPSGFSSILPTVTTGASIRAGGTVQESLGKGQSFELVVSSLEVLGISDESYPLQKKGHSLEFLRQIAHLRGRTNTFGAVFRVRNVLSRLVHKFFQDRGFIWAHTPLITASDCEGAGEMFRVTTFDLGSVPKTEDGKVDYSQDFFGTSANLTVSGQLEGEVLCSSFSDIYTFGPTFRAENSNTTRHLSEFWMIEPEMAFCDLKGDMKIAEEFVRFLLANVIKEARGELEFLQKFYKDTSIQTLEEISSKDFTRISYTDAIEELKKQPASKFEYKVEWGMDLQSEHERFLTDTVFGGPVIVYDYPKDIKAFYMRNNDDGKTVAAMDVLLPRIGELIGGSQREERVDLLEKRMLDMNMSLKDLYWYLDLRRYGSCPHAGFGLGFERLVQYVTGMTNIRDVIPFPRAPRLIEF